MAVCFSSFLLLVRFIIIALFSTSLPFQGPQGVQVAFLAPNLAHPLCIFRFTVGVIGMAGARGNGRVCMYVCKTYHYVCIYY